MLKRLKQRWLEQPLDNRFESIRFSMAIVVSLIVTLVLVLLVSNEPLFALQQLFLGPLASIRKFGNVIESMIPLTFLGLSVAIMFSARQFNLGSSGALFLGGTVTAVVVLTFPLPGFLLSVVAILLGAFTGGLITLIPAFIKLKFGASELVSSLMMNFISVNIGFFIILNYFRDPQAGSLASFQFPTSSLLQQLIPGTRIHTGLLILIVMIVLIYLFIQKTKWGYSLRMTGFNKSFATYSGISTGAVILYSQFLGGVLAGIAGSVEMLGMYDRFRWQTMPTYAFDGVIVAVLAKNKPQYIPFAAFVLSYIRIGADTMSVNSDVSFQVIAIIQGLIIIMIAANAFLSKYRQSLVVREAVTND